MSQQSVEQSEDYQTEPVSEGISKIGLILTIIATVVITAIIVVVGAIYFIQNSDFGNEDMVQGLQQQVNDLENQLLQLEEDNNIINNVSNIPTNWKTYSSDSFKISFQYPEDWYIREDNNRIYIENTQEDVNKANMPSDFQRIWISNWDQEVSLEKENNIKNGNQGGIESDGNMHIDTININGVVINTYEYITSGGPTLQAFWTDKFGKRYYATNSTEVGELNQRDMIENLKKILSTVESTNQIDNI
jgi:hypothetical protein